MLRAGQFDAHRGRVLAQRKPVIVEDFRSDAGFAPHRASAEAAGYRHKLETNEVSGRVPAGGLRSKSHLLLTWVDEIVRHLDVGRQREVLADPGGRHPQ